MRSPVRIWRDALAFRPLTSIRLFLQAFAARDRVLKRRTDHSQRSRRTVSADSSIVENTSSQTVPWQLNKEQAMGTNWRMIRKRALPRESIPGSTRFLFQKTLWRASPAELPGRSDAIRHRQPNRFQRAERHALLVVGGAILSSVRELGT